MVAKRGRFRAAGADRRSRADACGRGSARGARAAPARRDGSAGSARGSGRSRRALRAARGPCRRTGGCPSRTRRGDSARARCRAGPGRRRLAGSRLAEPMPSVTCVRGARATPPISVAQVVIRLPSWFELSKRRNSSTALRTRPGSASRRAFWSGQSSRHRRPLPIRLVVVSWPALSRKMQLCSSSGALERLAALACDQPRQHVELADRPARRGAARPGLRGRAGTRAPRDCRVAAARRSASARARRGWRATSRAAARAPRPARRAGCR